MTDWTYAGLIGKGCTVRIRDRQMAERVAGDIPGARVAEEPDEDGMWEIITSEEEAA